MIWKGRLFEETDGTKTFELEVRGQLMRGPEEELSNLVDQLLLTLEGGGTEQSLADLPWAVEGLTATA